MNLIRDEWNTSDEVELKAYLMTLGKQDRINWTTSILNTKLDVYAIQSAALKDVVKKIRQGNYLSFIAANYTFSHEVLAIRASLISGIKDFTLMKEHLLAYLPYIENWALCDGLTFKINDQNRASYLQLSDELIRDQRMFARRVGLLILLIIIRNYNIVEKVFASLEQLNQDEEYYIQMMSGWLLCECFIKHRHDTLTRLAVNNLNKKSLKFAIQKCRDSFRVSSEDKSLLLKFKN